MAIHPKAAVVSAYFLILANLISIKAVPAKASPRKELFTAIYRNQIESVEQLLRNSTTLPPFFNFLDPGKVNLNSRNHDGLTPLQYAAALGKLPIVMLILQRGVPVNQINDRGETAFHYAAAKGNLDLLQFLADRGAKIKAKDANGNLPVHMAAAQGNLTAVQFLLEKGNPLNQKNFIGATALHYAVSSENVELVQYLIDQGADINGVTKEKNTPLSLAIGKNSLQMVQLLISHGAQIDILDRSGNSLLILAAQIQSSTIIPLLLSRGVEMNHMNKYGFGAIHELAKSGRTDLMALLKEKGADLNLRSRHSWSPLLYAAMWDQVESVKWLIDQGAHFTWADFYGLSSYSGLPTFRTKAIKSALRIYLRIVETKQPQKLFKLKFKITSDLYLDGNLRNWLYHYWDNRLFEIKASQAEFLTSRFNNIFHSARHGNLDRVQQCISEGADVNRPTSKGNTPLILAASEGHTEVVRLLLNSGAKINQKGKYQRTALMIAARNGHLDTVKVLLENGADFNLQDRNVMIAADYAHLNFHEGVRELLQNYARIYFASDLEKILNVKEKISHELRYPGETQDWLNQKLFEKARYLYFSERENGLIQSESAAAKMISAMKILMEGELHQTCSICLTQKRLTLGHTSSGPAECACYICRECLPQWVGFELNQNGANPTVCPQCMKPVKSSYLKRSGLDKSEVNKFAERQVTQIQSRLPHWSFCPTPNCSGGRQMQEGESAFYNCSICQFEGCLKCGVNHHGNCEQSMAEDEETRRQMNLLLEWGKLAPPKQGHPKNMENTAYFFGRFRPCYYCGVISEKEINGTQVNGQCNAVVCNNPQCKKHWHWNYGDHKNHPRIGDSKEMHDFQCEEQKYEPLRPPHF